MKRGFTLLELLMAISILGVMTVMAMLTFNTVTSTWQDSCDYVDRLERSDYSLDQLVSALKSAYYPRGGEQTYDHGFMLTDNGDGDSVRDSDVIEWSKLGSALVGGDAAGDTLHRIQVRVLEAGDSSWGTRIEKTGLYARVKPVAKLIESSTSHHKDDDFSFASDELYRPFLIAKDVEGFDCKVQAKEPESVRGEKKSDRSVFEETFDASNSIPYKVQLTLYMRKEDPEFASRRDRVPLMSVVRMPLHEQSLDGATLPNADSKSTDRKGGGGSGGGRGNRGGGRLPPPGGGPR